MSNSAVKTNGWDFAIALVLAAVSCVITVVIKGIWHDIINVCLTCQGNNCELVAKNGLWICVLLTGIDALLIFSLAKRAKYIVNGIVAVSRRLKGKSEVFNCDGEK